jgi:hypothetical protein
LSITETLGALGSWSIQLVDDTPRSVTDQLGYFGHIGIWRGRVDVGQATDAALLASARYVGVLREKPSGRGSLEGSGMVLWLGDEDGKGAVLENPVVFTAASLTTCVTTLLPPAVTVGTIHDPGGTYSGTHQWQTPRDVLDTICTAFGVEYRVNGDGTVDVGTAAQLYGTTPSTIISARGAGQDFDLTSLGADFTTDTSVVDYSSRLVLIGQQTTDAGDSTPFVEAAADATTFPYKDLHGNAVHITRTVSDSGQTDASAPAAAQLQLNLYNRTKTALRITAADYEISDQAVVGQNAYVFDPDNGLFDPGTQVDFRGELIFPMVIRITAVTWPVTEGHTVAFRTGAGVWVDVTRWVAWETGSDDITVGDLPRTLTTGSNPVLDQTQAAPDASIPGVPTGLALTTTAVQSSKGNVTATVSAAWTAPALNTDGSVVQDLSHYLVQYRWQARAPQWTTVIAPTTSIDLPGLSVGLVYDVQVAAVDLTGHVSAFTGVQSITASFDTIPPNPPSDPVVGSYLGQLKITWDGKDNAGAAMPPDFAVVEVHVSATAGFTPDSSPGSATLVSQLSTAGVAYATAPYGATRYVKLIAVDNSLNRSAPSGQVSGATTQVADGDIASLNVGKLTAGTIAVDVTVSGRVATALTGARTELNALGFQKFAADGVTKMIDFTGAQNLLTGTLQTDLAPNRRIVSGSSGSKGSIQFIAPDGTTATLLSQALLGGNEGVSLHLPVPGVTSDFWNTFRIDSTGLAFIDAKYTHLAFGGIPGANDGDFRVAFATTRGDATHQPVLTDRLVITETGLWIYDNDGLNRTFISEGTTQQVYAGGLGGTGNFTVFEYDPSSGLTAARQIMSAEGVIDFYRSPGSDFTVHERASGGGSFSDRFRITDTHNWFNWPGTGSRLLIMPPVDDLTSRPDISGRIQMVNHYGFGAELRFLSTSAGASGRIEVHDAGGAGTWVNISCGTVTQNSTLSSKADVKKYAGDPLALLLRPQLVTFRYKGALSTGGERGDDGPIQHGFAAEQLPDELVTFDENGGRLGINLGAGLAFAIGAIQRLDARLTHLEGAPA